MTLVRMTRTLITNSTRPIGGRTFRPCPQGICKQKTGGYAKYNTHHSVSSNFHLITHVRLFQVLVLVRTFTLYVHFTGNLQRILFPVQIAHVVGYQRGAYFETYFNG